MPGKNSIGDEKLLQKKIPSNARYSEVKSRLDTGHSKTRYMKKIEEMKLNSQSKKNELFKRMKITTLAQLVLQVANLAMQEDVDLSPRALEGDADGSLTSDRRESENKNDNNESRASSRYSLQSVIRGMGEIDVANGNKPKPKSPMTPLNEQDYKDCPYLLLDVRDPEEFEACHLIGAKNFPVAMLSRTMNCFRKDILEYKNKPGKIIVLYDEDEHVAVMAGTTMAQRDFDNIFILSGGLKVLATKIPEGMTTGSWPAACRPPVAHRKSAATQAIEKQAADSKKCRFTGEDLDRISLYLNECLVPKDTGSRLSRLTSMQYRKANTQSKLSTTATTSAASKRAWR